VFDTRLFELEIMIMTSQSGNVVEMGTHEKLLNLGGTYANLIQKQMFQNENIE
jgi:ABC-type multidrug transport system fused ATPase/permease subunit